MKLNVKSFADKSAAAVNHRMTEASRRHIPDARDNESPYYNASPSK